MGPRTYSTAICRATTTFLLDSFSSLSIRNLNTIWPCDAHADIEPLTDGAISRNPKGAWNYQAHPSWSVSLISSPYSPQRPHFGPCYLDSWRPITPRFDSRPSICRTSSTVDSRRVNRQSTMSNVGYKPDSSPPGDGPTMGPRTYSTAICRATTTFLLDSFSSLSIRNLNTIWPCDAHADLEPLTQRLQCSWYAALAFALMPKTVGPFVAALSGRAAPFLASLSASSLPSILQCSGHHRTWTSSDSVSSWKVVMTCRWA
jgi:hypothetical protein